jgi:hypothetical protein
MILIVRSRTGRLRGPVRKRPRARFWALDQAPQVSVFTRSPDGCCGFEGVASRHNTPAAGKPIFDRRHGAECSFMSYSTVTDLARLRGLSTS